MADLLGQLHDDVDVEPPRPVEQGAAISDPRTIERPVGERIVIESTGGIRFDPTFASIPARAGGFLVDTLVVALFALPGVALGRSSPIAGVLLGAIGVAAALVWQTRSIARSGRWIGNRLMRTTVVDARNGRLLDGGSAFGRVVTRHLISTVLMFGYFPALVDRQRRTFHDRVATSVVIARQRDSWRAGDADPDADPATTPPVEATTTAVDARSGEPTA